MQCPSWKGCKTLVSPSLPIEIIEWRSLFHFFSSCIMHTLSISRSIFLLLPFPPPFTAIHPNSDDGTVHFLSNRKSRRAKAKTKCDFEVSRKLRESNNLRSDKVEREVIIQSNSVFFRSDREILLLYYRREDADHTRISSIRQHCQGNQWYRLFYANYKHSFKRSKSEFIFEFIDFHNQEIFWLWKSIKVIIFRFVSLLETPLLLLHEEISRLCTYSLKLTVEEVVTAIKVQLPY